ncbi:MAG: R3H domain-containing nucleic acid-binding protein [Candidatus Gracilibacteria bacterium]
MELERMILQTLEEFMKQLGVVMTNVELTKDEDGTYRVNLETEDAKTLIGHHGESLIALQHMVKLMLWRKIDESGKSKLAQNEESFSFVLDVENYRKRQEENVLKMAEQKAEMVRKTRKNQTLPPMSPYFRRLIHVHFTKPEYQDLETVSSGEGDFRQVTIRSKTLIEE